MCQRDLFCKGKPQIISVFHPSHVWWLVGDPAPLFLIRFSRVWSGNLAKMCAWAKCFLFIPLQRAGGLWDTQWKINSEWPCISLSFNPAFLSLIAVFWVRRLHTPLTLRVMTNHWDNMPVHSGLHLQLHNIVCFAYINNIILFLFHGFKNRFFTSICENEELKSRRLTKMLS